MSKLRVGDAAPDFAGQMQDGSTIRLADFLGRKTVILFFYPKDASPICTREACSFRDSYERFLNSGAEVIGVSGDSIESHQAFAHDHHLPFPLISDADGTLRRVFGVSSVIGMLPGRATYVIDKDGIVRLIFTAQFASEAHVTRALEAVQ